MTVDITNSKSFPVYLKVVLLKVKSGNAILIPAYAILDNGSQSTLIREDFSRQLVLKGKANKVNINSINNKVEKFKVSLYSLLVHDKRQKQSFDLKLIFSVPKRLFNSSSQVPMKDTVYNKRHKTS